MMTNDERISLIIGTARLLDYKYAPINKLDAKSKHCHIKFAAAMSSETLNILYSDNKNRPLEIMIRKITLINDTIPSGWTRPSNIHTINGESMLIRIPGKWVYLIKEDLPLGKVIVRAWDGIDQKWLPVE